MRKILSWTLPSDPISPRHERAAALVCAALAMATLMLMSRIAGVW